MGVFEMVVLVTTIGCATGVATEYLKTQRKRADATNQDDLEDALDRIDEMEERIRVLERVVTDDKYSLSQQIDNLKDP